MNFYLSLTIKCRKYEESTSSSSCHAASTDIPDPLSPHLPIVHHLCQVFRAISRILTYKKVLTMPKVLRQLPNTVFDINFHLKNFKKY